LTQQVPGNPNLRYANLFAFNLITMVFDFSFFFGDLAMALRTGQIFRTAAARIAIIQFQDTISGNAVCR